MRIAICALVVLFLSGCALAPNTAHIAVTHVSQPFRGAGPAPFGGEALPETTYEALELGGRWQHGNAFAESSIAYVVHETYLAGGPWVFSAKAGYAWALK